MDVPQSSGQSGGVVERLLALTRQLAEETHPGRSGEVGLDTSFERELGLDSLARVELMLRIGRACGAELPAEALSEADSVRALLRYVGQQARHGAELAGELRAGRGAALPEQAQTLVDVLEWHAGRQPEQVHILLRDERQRELPIRYRDLLEGARSIAAGLRRRGVQPQQTVALMLPTGRDYLDAFFGALLAGAIPVPIYPPARMAQIEDHLQRHARILANAGAVLVVTVERAKPVARLLQAAVPSLAALVTPAELRAAPEVLRWRPSAGDVAFLQYTSGSTGDPKGVVLTHANLLANVRALGMAARATPADVFVSWLPLYHDMGLIGAWFGSLYHGMPLILMPPLAFLARPALWLESITRHRGTLSAAPNFAYELCVRHISESTLASFDLSSWRLAFNGAEPVSPATLDAFQQRFGRCGLRRETLTPVYGLAESSVGLAFPPLGRGPRVERVRREPFAREGRAEPAGPQDADCLTMVACGRPLPGHQIRIVDQAGLDLPERRVGRLEFRGPSATSGYYRNPLASSRLFDRGWLDSGDYAYLAEGEVFLAGRAKDLIKRGGRNLYPYDLEQAIGSLPRIRRGCVAVFGSLDPGSGVERLIVMAETGETDAHKRDTLRASVNQAAIEVTGTPADEVVLVPPHSVLKTSSGKIRRAACRELYERGDAGKPPAAPWLRDARFAAAEAAASARLAARRAAAWLFAAYSWSMLALLAVPCGALIALLHRPAAGRRIARAAARGLFRLTGSMPAARGLERLPARPHVLVVNHASYLDAIALSALLPSEPGYAFAAKREFESQPAMRALLGGLGTLFVERFDVRRSSSEAEAMAAALRRGASLIVFPEGTFTRAAGLRDFHGGAFVAAARAGVPVCVAGLRGTRAALPPDSWLPRRAALAFEVGGTLAAAGAEWSDAAALALEARAALLALCGEFDAAAGTPAVAPPELR